LPGAQAVRIFPRFVEKALALLRRSEPLRPARAIDMGGRAGVVIATFGAALIGAIALLKVW